MRMSDMKKSVLEFDGTNPECHRWLKRPNGKRPSCAHVYQCCDCGGGNCDCSGCFSCNACESCLEAEELWNNG